MRAYLARLSRRFIRSQLAKTSPERLLKIGEGRLLRCFRRAVKNSPAYKHLLAEVGVDPARIQSPADFVERCPVLDKANTFKRFPIRELLATDVSPADLASVLTSSGHGGGGFALGLSTRAQFKTTPKLIDLGLDIAFDIDQRRTLLINCLPMGVTFHSEAVCVANVSVREDMACAIVLQAGDLFDQIVLCGDPLFLKRLCDYSESIGVDWARYRLNVIVGEETFAETFREYLAKVLHVALDHQDSGLIGSSMGVGELGLNLFNETRETVALRRACISDSSLLPRLTGRGVDDAPVPTFLVFNPLRTYVEVINADAYGVGDLLVTVLDDRIPVPLMRYCTGDRIQILDRSLLLDLAKARPDLKVPPLPVIALHGRAKDQLPGGGHVDMFKEALYRQPATARYLSGAHRITREAEGIRWEVQVIRDHSVDLDTLADRLQSDLAPRLGVRLNTRCLAYDAFPYGKTLDYERKFAYWLPG